MKQIHLHEEARKYVQEHIVPETDCEGHEIIDLMKHLQYFALLQIKQFAKDEGIEVIVKIDKQ